MTKHIYRSVMIHYIAYEGDSASFIHNSDKENLQMWHVISKDERQRDNSRHFIIVDILVSFFLHAALSDHVHDESHTNKNEQSYAYNLKYKANRKKNNQVN